MHIGIITLFPEMFSALTKQGVTGRAVKKGILELDFWNPRDYAVSRNNSVDDRPFGGGAGMIMKIEPLEKALFDAKRHRIEKTKIIYLSPQGRLLDQKATYNMVSNKSLILVAGRYEGIDQRFIDIHVDEEWSIGNYILSGGELACMVLIDAVTRLLPGALGNILSHKKDSFEGGLLKFPQYTRPAIHNSHSVPQVLINGNHRDIETWRLEQSLECTHKKRPDLLKDKVLSNEERKLLEKYILGKRN